MSPSGPAQRRVVVTGLGTVSPLGTGVGKTWEGLIAGRSGVGPITLFDPAALKIPVTIAAEASDFDPESHFGKREIRHRDRFTLLAIVAARDALADSGLEITGENSHHVGTLIASGIGGMTSFYEAIVEAEEKGYDRISPFLTPKMIPNIAAGEIAIEFGARGPCSCTVTACSASANAIGDGGQWIGSGRADVVIAGGSEAAIMPMGIGGFAAMKALSTRNDEPQRASRPFDAERDGFVCGEGAAVLILEELEHARARGARVYAELIGYGMSADAHHITAPQPEGEGAARAMQQCLEDAGRKPAEVDYINAHGTSTPPNDRTETLCIKTVFGDGARSVAVSSTKSMTGHLLGAAGALESLICVKAIETGVIPPTINYEHPDPDCDLDYVPNEARRIDVRLALTNSFGFGGHNVCLAFAAPD